VQFLAGPRDIRKGGLGLILKAIAWISLVVGPVLLLLLFQIQLLPYHLEWLTWLHRFAILADLILLLQLWPAVLERRGSITWRPLRRHPVFALASLIPIWLAFTTATFPGEWLDEHVGNRRWIPPNGATAWLGPKNRGGYPNWTSFHDLLFNGEVDEVTGRRKSLFSNTLVLPGFDALEAAKIDDPKKLDSVKSTSILRGRHLENVVFYRVDLSKADVTGAHLQGASLYFAQLQGATLYDAQLQGASLDLSQLQGASLLDAQLQGASLLDAQLQGASLLGARLQDASLSGAQLQGASFYDAQLQGASLGKAPLQGAHFGGATLAGTELRNVAVWRTSFKDASLTTVLEDGLEEYAPSKRAFAALQAMIMKNVPKGENREDALKRIE
jgi:uncharacterized protein YjbI with pentapeptide repeats